MRPLSYTEKGSAVIGGFFWDKDDWAVINLAFTAFGKVAEELSVMPKGSIISGSGSLKNVSGYAKTASAEDNNLREIVIMSLHTDYVKQNENKKPYVKPQEKPKEEKIEEQELIITEDDLPF
jgi:hypothetical protein